MLFANISRSGFAPIPVKAATGAIGGDLSHEFQILAKTGESELAYDSKLVSDDLIDKSYEEITSMYSASDEMIDKNKSDVVMEEVLKWVIFLILVLNTQNL